MTVALPSLKISANLNRRFVSAYKTFVGFEKSPRILRGGHHSPLEQMKFQAWLAGRSKFFVKRSVSPRIVS